MAAAAEGTEREAGGKYGTQCACAVLAASPPHPPGREGGAGREDGAGRQAGSSLWQRASPGAAGAEAALRGGRRRGGGERGGGAAAAAGAVPAAALPAGRRGAAALALLPQRLPPGIRAAGRGAAGQPGGAVVALGAGPQGAGVRRGFPAPRQPQRWRPAGPRCPAAAELRDAPPGCPGAGRARPGRSAGERGDAPGDAAARYGPASAGVRRLSGLRAPCRPAPGLNSSSRYVSALGRSDLHAARAWLSQAPQQRKCPNVHLTLCPVIRG